MSEATTNWDFRAGDDVAQSFTLTGYDVTGWSARSELYLRPDSPTPAATFVVIVDGPSNSITLTLDEAVSAAVKPGDYQWSLKTVDLLGKTDTFVSDIVTVKPELTK